MNLLFENQPTIFNDIFYNYFETYKKCIRFYTSNKILYDIFIYNNKFENMYYTPESNEELQTAVNEWCNNKDETLIKYGDINSWNTIYITSMKMLFCYKRNFNDNISDWNVSNVENMRGMFYNNVSFNQELNNWDVSNVKDMNCMFSNISLTTYPEWYKQN